MTKSMWQAVSAVRKQLGAELLKAAALAVTLAAAGAASAASYTNSATGNWDADASWTGAKPAALGAADAAIVFSSAGVNSTNNLAGNFLLNRLEFAAGTTLLSGNTLVFTNSGATGPQLFNASGSLATLNNPIVLGSDTTVCTSNSITLNGLISGKGGLIKTGPYLLTLTNNNNTYVGTTLVSAGTLGIQGVGNTATAASTNFTVLGGATLRLYDSKANPFWTAPNNSVFNVQSNATFAIEVNALQGGYLNAPSGATVSGSPQLMGLDKAAQKTAILGSLNLARIILVQSGATPTQTVRFDGTGAGLKIGTDSGTPFSWRNSSATGLLTYNMDIADSPAAAVDLLVPWLNIRPNATGIAFFKQGAGLMQLSGLDWTGVGSAYSNSPVACTVSGGTLVLNTSAYNGVGVNFAGLTVSNGATLQLGTNGVAGAIYTNVANEGTVAFNRSDAYTFGKAISGSGSVVQKGSGTLTLNGANTYSGETLVQAGALLVSAPGSLAAGSAVTVTGGILGGTGTINGPITVSAGGTLAPGGTNAIATLALPNSGDSALTLNGGRLHFDLSNVAGTCDLLTVTGRLVLNGANTVSLSFPNGTPPAGFYTLMTYAPKTGSGSLTLSTPYPNARLDVGETSATLTVTGSGITYLKWTGNVSGVWDTSTLNWTREGVASAYAEGDAVLFDDTATGALTISSAAPVAPSSVTFNNSSTNYVLSASIAGSSTPVYKLGSGTVSLSGTNTYGGGTTFAAGMLSIAAYTNLPTVGGLTFSGGALRFTGTGVTSLDPYAVNWGSFNGGLNITNLNASLTVTNTIGGSGSLTKDGVGTLVLLGTNTYSGGTTVNAGFVRISNNSGVGSGAINMTGANCQLDLMGGLNMTNAITVRGVGVVNSVGSLQSFTGTSNTWSGPITLGESGARLGGANATLTVSGVINSGANPWGPIIRMPAAGGGTLVLTTNNTWLGSTWIRCGTVKLGINNALPPSVSLQLGLGASQVDNVAAALDLAGFNQQVAGLFNAVPIDNLRVVTNSAAAPSTLTVANPSAAYSYDGVIAGNVSLVKSGNGTLTLAGANTTYGGFTVNGGVLAVNANGTLGANSTNIIVNAGTLALSNSVSIADNAAVQIANGGGAKVSLGAGVSETVGYLYFADKMRPGGTYSAVAGSGVSVVDAVHFSGTGVLKVLHGNGGTLLKMR